MPRASRGRANDVGFLHSKKSPLVVQSTCTYVYKCANKTGRRTAWDAPPSWDCGDPVGRALI